jgi:hypothetical protein
MITAPTVTRKLSVSLCVFVRPLQSYIASASSEKTIVRSHTIRIRETRPREHQDHDHQLRIHALLLAGENDRIDAVRNGTVNEYRFAAPLRSMFF